MTHTHIFCSTAPFRYKAGGRVYESKSTFVVNRFYASYDTLNTSHQRITMTTIFLFFDSSASLHFYGFVDSEFIRCLLTLLSRARGRYIIHMKKKFINMHMNFFSPQSNQHSAEVELSCFGEIYEASYSVRASI